MKKSILLTLIITLTLNFCYAQKPEPVYSIIKQQKPHSFFVEQAELWWKEIQKNKKNEKAWYYYYKANRYANMTFCSDSTDGEWVNETKYLKEADEIKDLISKNIPKTFTDYYVKIDAIVSDGTTNSKLDYLQKAYAIQPDNPDLYDEFVLYYEIENDLNKRKEFNKIWYKSNDISSGLLAYNYNVLVSMKDNAIILTVGDNDTFPLWMLQDALGIRADVTILNISLLTIKEYRKKMFTKLGIPSIDDSKGFVLQDEILEHVLKNSPSNHPVYLGITAWNSSKDYEENLYMEGLVLEYSTENLDNIAILKNNFENKYNLDYTKNQFGYDISQEVVNKINLNYVPGIIKLYEHYKLSGDTYNMDKYRKLGLSIAQKVDKGWEEYILEKMN